MGVSPLFTKHAFSRASASPISVIPCENTIVVMTFSQFSLYSSYYSPFGKWYEGGEGGDAATTLYDMISQPSPL